MRCLLRQKGLLDTSHNACAFTRCICASSSPLARCRCFARTASVKISVSFEVLVSFAMTWISAGVGSRPYSALKATMCSSIPLRRFRTARQRSRRSQNLRAGPAHRCQAPATIAPQMADVPMNTPLALAIRDFGFRLARQERKQSAHKSKRRK